MRDTLRKVQTGHRRIPGTAWYETVDTATWIGTTSRVLLVLLEELIAQEGADDDIVFPPKKWVRDAPIEHVHQGPPTDLHRGCPACAGVPNA